MSLGIEGCKLTRWKYTNTVAMNVPTVRRNLSGITISAVFGGIMIAFRAPARSQVEVSWAECLMIAGSEQGGNGL